MSLVILVPVLRRPHRVAPLLESINKTTPDPYRVLFIASPNDEAEYAALNKEGAEWIQLDENYEMRGDYARKINAGYSVTYEKYLFLGADDVEFHPFWLEKAMDKMSLSPSFGVVGTNDLGNRSVMMGKHATHSLVRRSYILENGTIDEHGKVLHEGYPHEYVDNEFVETAMRRKAWVFAPGSIVEHLHPHWNKAPMDSLYGAYNARMVLGRRVFMKRRKLWMT